MLSRVLPLWYFAVAHDHELKAFLFVCVFLRSLDTSRRFEVGQKSKGLVIRRTYVFFPDQYNIVMDQELETLDHFQKFLGIISRYFVCIEIWDFLQFLRIEFSVGSQDFLSSEVQGPGGLLDESESPTQSVFIGLSNLKIEESTRRKFSTYFSIKPLNKCRHKLTFLETKKFDVRMEQHQYLQYLQSSLSES